MRTSGTKLLYSKMCAEMVIIMNLYYIKYFVTLAEYKHYTKAANALCITQPSLSHAIAQLEKELGVPLFERSGRNTTLTRFGQEFLVYAKQTLSTIDEGVESIKKSARGDGIIRLGFLRPLGVDYIPELVTEYMKKNSGRDIQFTFHTDVTGRLVDGMIDRKYDVLFCSRPDEACGLTAKKVMQEKLVLIAPKGHSVMSACDGDGKIKLVDTLSYPYIFFDKSSGMRGVVDELFNKCGSFPDIAYETEEDEVVAGLVAAGLGIAVIADIPLIHQMKLDIADIAEPEYERSIYMVTDNSIYMPTVVSDFVNYVMSTKKNEADKELI